MAKMQTSSGYFADASYSCQRRRDWEHYISCYKWALGLIVFHFMNWFVRLLYLISLTLQPSIKVDEGDRKAPASVIAWRIWSASCKGFVDCHGRHGKALGCLNIWKPIPFPYHKFGWVGTPISFHSDSLEMCYISCYPSIWQFWGTSIHQLDQKQIRKPWATCSTWAAVWAATLLKSYFLHI